MTLTVCVGASGSGKTTFLNDVHKSHKCTYIRQYHNLRPYIGVSAIPNFDPTQLPYWDIYVKEKKDKSIIVGGTLAGQFMPGLSGGQRKLLLFELIFQRTASQDNLLIVLDEPFAGVTDDFVPFIVERLNEMRKKHNILLVTNDHVETLKKMADNTVTVSAIDRTKVKVNGREGIDRATALLAMSIGDEYQHSTNNDDLAFFVKVEFSKSGGILNVVAFAIFAFSLFLLMYWDSQPGSEALVLIAAGLVSFFTANPYFLQLTDWRIYMMEEAEALLHSSKNMNKLLKTLLTLVILVIVNSVQFGCQEAVIGTLSSWELYVGIIFDNLSLLVAMILFGLYSDLPDAAVQILGAMPFLFMVFFSTTFSPGAGVKGLKELRYLFSRYYLWCMLPVDIGMEGCPEENTLLYLVLSSLLVPFLFVAVKVTINAVRNLRMQKKQASNAEMKKSREFATLQLEMFGERALNNLLHLKGSRMTQKSMYNLAASLAKGDEEDGESSDTGSTDSAKKSDSWAKQSYDQFLNYLNEEKADPEKPGVGAKIKSSKSVKFGGETDVDK